MKKAVKAKPHFITDNKGKKLSVVISFKEYQQMLEDLEELADIRMYDAVKAKKETTIPFSDYLKKRSLKKHA